MDVILGLQASFRRLQDLPSSGMARDWLSPGLRVTFYHPYALYYRIVPDAVVVVRVLHGARDASALAARGGFV